LVGALGNPRQSHADAIALTFDYGTEGASLVAPTSQMSGWRFDVHQKLSVMALGFWQAPGHSLSEAHPVGIWTDSGVLRVSGTVLPSSSLVSGFRFAPVTPVVLTPGRYRIAAFYSATNTDLHLSAFGNADTIPEISYVDRAFSSGGSSSFAFPASSNADFLDASFGPTFSAVPLPVPEPATAVLAGCGLLTLVPLARALRGARQSTRG
jgi:hypothetical protein